MYAVFSSDSPPQLVVLPKGEMMNSVKYCGVLRDTTVPHMRHYNLHHLLADKAPCHTSQMSKRFVAVRISMTTYSHDWSVVINLFLNAEVVTGFA